MKYEEGGDNVNPWDVGKLEEFMYFICPECDKRDQSREHFLQHAMNEISHASYYFLIKNHALCTISPILSSIKK